MNKIQKKDILNFLESFPDDLKKKLRGKSFLVTGATGLIGSSIVRCLLALEKDINITCPVRNKNKAVSMYGYSTPNVVLIESDIIEYTENIHEKFDYIIHCASPTNGKYMIKHPVETYTLAIEVTHNLLEYARNHIQCTVLFVSSLEFYGQVLDDKLITESSMGYIDIASPRSCYPLGKQAAEYLCFAYNFEYNVDVKIARLTQTFGAGISNDDNRVFAQFAKSIVNNTDIILHTKGLSAKPYIYTIDCVSAILYILLKGKAGEAYNVANEHTYISIKELAHFLCEKFNPSVSVIIKEESDSGYAPITRLNLSTGKLRDLGWVPHYDLYRMFANLIDYMKE